MRRQAACRRIPRDMPGSDIPPLGSGSAKAREGENGRARISPGIRLCERPPAAAAAATLKVSTPMARIDTVALRPSFPLFTDSRKLFLPSPFRLYRRGLSNTNQRLSLVHPLQGWLALRHFEYRPTSLSSSLPLPETFRAETQDEHVQSCASAKHDKIQLTSC